MEELMELFWNDEEELFEQRLDEMEATRDNAEELLEAIEAYDMPLLYQQLLDKYESVLTDEERERVRRRYEARFDLPL